MEPSDLHQINRNHCDHGIDGKKSFHILGLERRGAIV
jgi:hypothetical protein